MKNPKANRLGPALLGMVLIKHYPMIVKTIATTLVLITFLSLSLAADQAITNFSNPRTISANIALPPEVHQQLERQKRAMRAIYLEFAQTSQGTLSGWDYGVTRAFSAYFERGNFYRHEQQPGYHYSDNEVAFDGQTIWQRSTSRATKCSLADAAGLLPRRLVEWPYLLAAGIYAPQYISELERFSSLEPLALHYLEQSRPTKVQVVGDNLWLEFQIEDEVANLQKIELERQRTDQKGTTAPPRGPALNVKGQKATMPTRTVALLLDSKHGYGIATREEWNTAGQRTGRLQSEDWKFYARPGIWLPSRCVAFYYARPRIFASDFSEQPVHIVTNDLKRVEFTEKNIPFAFDQKKSGNHIFDRKAPHAASTTVLPLATQEKVDVATIERIKTEVLRRSQVMDIVGWLTDVYGPRLTGSPNTEAAADWAVATMRSWGLTNVHLEPWGPYERGWTSERFTFRAVTPQPFIINAVPATWSHSTKGRITGAAIRFDVHSFADMQRYAGKLQGAFLLMDPMRPTPAHFEPQAARLSDARLTALSGAEPPSQLASNEVVELRYTDKIVQDPETRRWLVNEGVAAVLFVAPGDGGTIFMLGNGVTGWLSKNEPDQLPIVKVNAESYGRIARILEKNIPVTLELDMQNTYYDSPKVFNIIADIPGNDPKLKDEVVMMGAHFDSWAFGTGATDNAAGSAMLMEAMRILKTLNLQPRRTISIALWTGEEQGVLGSKAYVAQHYGDRKDPSRTRSEHDNFSAYFDLDGGTGKIRGVFTPGNAAAGPIFDAWMGPFNDMGMKTVSPWDIGGGDDLSFRRAGLPTFGFIQDPIEYGSRTHHSNADVYERIQAEDLQFNTAVLASFAWQAAQRDEKLPR